MTGITMPALQAFAETVAKVSTMADNCIKMHWKDNARVRVRNALAFYQVAMLTTDPMIRSVNFDAAKSELAAAAAILKMKV